MTGVATTRTLVTRNYPRVFVILVLSRRLKPIPPGISEHCCQEAWLLQLWSSEEPDSESES